MKFGIRYHNYDFDRLGSNVEIADATKDLHYIILLHSLLSRFPPIPTRYGRKVR